MLSNNGKLLLKNIFHLMTNLKKALKDKKYPPGFFDEAKKLKLQSKKNSIIFT
jgi:hypothetical protein